MDRRGWMEFAFAVTGVFALLLFSAPYMAPYSTFTGLDGTMGFIDNGWLGHGPAGLAYLFGDVFCHQQEARSLILNGSQMPVCIRDAGIFLGLAVGFAASLLIGDRAGRPLWMWVGIVMCTVTVAEWLAEWVVGDMSVARFVSGLVSGTGAGIFLCWMLYRVPGKDNHRPDYPSS